MRIPGDLYTLSPRPYKGLGELNYPLHDWTATMTHCGRICYNRRKIDLSIVFAGQNVGVKLGRPQRRPECCAREDPAEPRVQIPYELTAPSRSRTSPPVGLW